ncbi:hypothetical protein [Spirosoma sp.]|uniref:hypothetical protein n=1 Tax=Spirosoma sp. TaxID=1899569 RepID=UPI003B3B77FA
MINLRHITLVTIIICLSNLCLAQSSQLNVRLKILVKTIKYKNRIFYKNLSISIHGYPKNSDIKEIKYATEYLSTGQLQLRLNGKVTNDVVGKETILQYELPVQWKSQADSYIRQMSKIEVSSQSRNFNSLKSLSTLLGNTYGLTPTEIVCKFISSQSK